MPLKGRSRESAKGFAAGIPGRKDTPGRDRARDGAGRAAGRKAEQRLLLAARSGDPRALQDLLLQAAAPAWRWSKGFCRDPDDAADLVQDVLHTLLRSLGSFRGDASLSSWTHVVARRACARRRSRERRQQSLDAPAHAHLRDLADDAAGPAKLHERRELTARLEAAIGALPESQRQVLVMRDVEGLSAGEVGEVLGLGVRAVKSRLHRARLSLRERLAPYVSGGDAPAPSASCPETARLLSRWFEGELSASTCATMERHVSACAACSGACASLRRVLGACRAYGEAAVPRELQRAVRDAVRRSATGA